MNKLEEIKNGLKCWDDHFPLNPPESKTEELLREEIKRRAQTFHAQGIENVRYLLSIIKQAEKDLQSIVDYPNTEMKSPEDLGYTYQTLAEEALQAIRK